MLVEAPVRGDLELTPLQKTLEDRARVARRGQPNHAKRDVAASDRVDGLHEGGDVVGRRLQVADEEDRGVRTLSRSRIDRASSSADEMRVPARKVPVHGFTGLPSLGGTSSLSIGRRCDAGVPGGSSS